MIDDHKEETAALYALDLLEGAEREVFERELATNAPLRALVDQLRRASAELATIADPKDGPSTDLRRRVLASIAQSTTTSSTADETPAGPATIVRVPWAAWLGWAAAACFALLAGYFGVKYTGTRAELVAAAERAELASIESKSLNQHIEAATIVHKSQLAALQQAADLDQLKIARLVELASDKKAAVAIAVWNPSRQEGILAMSGLPPLTADEDYQLWVIDPQNRTRPVSAGIMTAEGRVRFRPDEPVSGVAMFAVSRERKGGSTTAKGPQGRVVAAGEL